MNINPLNLAIFAYNFPHKKTQDFLLRLIIENIFPKVVLATEPVKLEIPAPTIRVKPKHIDLVHPKDICDKFGIEYLVVDHNSIECCNILKGNHIDIAVISGARILKESVIKSVSKGIINIHPGLLPEGRGLDALQWAIFEKRKLGVTAHVINRKVDHGHILIREIIPEYKDDTFIDLSLRLEQTQINILTDAINKLRASTLDLLDHIDDNFPLHKKMPAELEKLLPNLLSERLTQNGK